MFPRVPAALFGCNRTSLHQSKPQNTGETHPRQTSTTHNTQPLLLFLHHLYIHFVDLTSSTSLSLSLALIPKKSSSRWSSSPPLPLSPAPSGNSKRVPRSESKWKRGSVCSCLFPSLSRMSVLLPTPRRISCTATPLKSTNVDLDRTCGRPRAGWPTRLTSPPLLLPPMLSSPVPT